MNLDQDQARQALIDAANKVDRIKPEIQPSFPGLKPAYPKNDEYPRLDNKSAEKVAANKILDLLSTTWTTFVAQARIRDELYDTVKYRLGIKESLEYERFIDKYYSEMNNEELYLHKTIRAYTENVLSEYNQRILDVIENHPILLRDVKLVTRLRDHLVIWLAKYQGSFLSTPSKCLVYVGVEEEVKFPDGVTHELKLYVTADSG